MDPSIPTPVDIDTVSPVLQPVNIDTQPEGSPAPTAPVAEARSKKASYGVGELLGKSQAEIQAAILMGKEDDLRKEASAKINALNEQKRIQSVIDLTNKQGKTLTLEQFETLRKPPSDPNAVFEDGYAQKYLDNIFPTSTTMNGTDMDNAMAVAPDVVMSDVDKAKTHLSNYDYARRRFEDLEQSQANQGWVPYLYDEARTVIPFYSMAKLSGWMKTQPSVSGILPGTNLDEQTRALLRLPGPEFREKFDYIIDALSGHNGADKNWIDNGNLAVARQYANAVLGMSTSDVGLQNLNTAIDVSTLPIAAAAKLGMKSVLSVRTALKDAVKSAGKEAVTGPASVAEALGDTGSAATLRASDNIVNDMKDTTQPVTNSANLNIPNDPIARARQALPSAMITDTQNIAANGRPLSQELLNRIVQDQNVASKAIVDVIEKTAAVQRISLEEAGPIVMNRIKEEVKNQNPGIRNAIADIGDPVWNPFSKTYDFPVKVFSWTGEQFSTEATARRFMAEHGIAEAEVAGKSGAHVYVPEDVFLKPDTTGVGTHVPTRFEVSAADREVKIKQFQPEVKLNKQGKPIGYSNKEFQVGEIEPKLRPELNHVPISVDENGSIKFHPTLKTGEDVARASIEQRGLGYHINIWKPLNEGQSIIKDLMINLESTKSIASRGGVDAWFNSIFPIGHLRTSDVTLSPFETLQRKTAGYSVSNFQKLLQNEVKYIQDVAHGRVRVDPVTGEDHNAILSYIRTLSPITSWNAKNKWADFKRALELAPSLKDAKGNNGYLWQNPYEISEGWRENFKRAPSFEEIRAWLAFRRNYENDRVFRSVREYTNKARLGAEQHNISYVDRNGNKQQSGFFEGVQLKSLPGGEHPIAIFDGGSVRIRMSNQIGGDWRKISDEIAKGESVATEIYKPKLRPLKGIPEVGTNYVRYVVTPTANRETKNLSWDQVNRLSGGHFNYDHEFAVKEADVQETRAGNTTYHSYERDKFFSFVNGRAQGKQITNVLNEVKRLLKAGDETAARDIFENGFKGENGPAMEWKDFLSKTKPGRDDAGNVTSPLINVNEPFYVVRKGKSILDMDNSLQNRYGHYNDRGEWTSTFQDRTKSGSLADQYKVGYTEERDADSPMQLRNIGSKNNPIYKFEPAKMIDPITTMNRALNEIIRSSVMDDMKIAGVETWLREAEPWLKAKNISEIRSSPWKFFKNADSKNAFRNDADPTVVANLLSNRFKTQQFIGTPSKYDLFMQDTAQKISDWSYDLLGPKGELVPTWAFTKLTSPVKLLRAMAYHAKLGLFALPQLLTQSQTYLTIAALSPRAAPAGTYAALLTQWAKFMEINPEALAHLDGWASKMNIPGLHKFKAGEWKEAYEEMHNRGFPNIGGEYGPLDTQLGHKYTQGIGGDILDAGQMFFKMAEQNVRYGAWFTSYVEYKAANPAIKAMSKTDWDKVLNRADDMSGNMTRASASMFQSGPLALTGQFLTYQKHLAEMYFSNRMSNLDRLRMHLMYGTMFGATGAFGVAGLPLGETIRKAAYDNGYVVGDNWLSSMLIEGLPAAGLAWLTSPDGDPKKGNWYNVGDKFGVGGLTYLRDAMKSDQSMWTFIGGAATSIAANTWGNTEGVRRSSWEMMHGSMMTGNDNDAVFKMTLDQWVDVFKEISSVDAGRKAFVAVQFGKWLSKNDGYQADVSKANGIFMALTGLNLQNAADNYVMGEAIKDRQNDQKKALNNFTREFRRAIMDGENDDYESFQKHMGNAYAYLKAYDYPIEEYPKAVSIASKNWETRINSIRQEFYTKNVPAGKEDKYGDAWTRFLQTQGQ